MKDNFDKAFELVIGFEGGYENDKDDPGGETKYGISKRAFPSLDIANITLDQAKNIYAVNYWRPMGCDNLPYPLDICVFDCAVNQGPSRARQILAKSDCWQAFLLNRMVHYQGLNKSKYFAGWINRVLNLYSKIGG